MVYCLCTGFKHFPCFGQANVQLMCEIDAACAFAMESETVVGDDQVEMFDREQLLQSPMVLVHPMQQVWQLAKESCYL